MMDYSFMLTT